ncbi:hypothetical protein AVEN_81609-1 [Araneus ventricosus]|uniref:Uncharacterized protein n=1 Tax=Araneus ventricosus TaxID=182803 RepID=A0A4Y2LGW2_ARAVE|nr:hypothetical protein AVEN_81609-1 [Araneus ventricosus]
MEKQLKCVLLLSLKEMALRRVAVLLWSGSDILASVAKFSSYLHYTQRNQVEWQITIVDKVVDKVFELELPKLLTWQLNYIVHPIGLEIRNWRERHKFIFFYDFKDINLLDLAKLRWTTVGAIDYRKTAKELVCSDALNVVERYKIACSYCLDDYIPLLWEKLPEGERREFYSEIISSISLPCLWPYILEGELDAIDFLWRTADRNLTSFNQCAFEESAIDFNKTAAEYFFQKLTHEEREASLVRTAVAVLLSSHLENTKIETRSNVVRYLLSLMTPEQRVETFKMSPVDFFLCFLDWPWQDLFLENVGLFWTLFPPDLYDSLLDKMMCGDENSLFYYPEIFKEFFIESPLDFKRRFVDQDSEDRTPSCYFLSIFCKNGDSRSIEVIFRNVDPADRLKLVFHPLVLKRFYYCMLDDRWHVVEVCLREATLSNEDRLRLKEAFLESLASNDTGEIEWKNPKREKLLCRIINFFLCWEMENNRNVVS